MVGSAPIGGKRRPQHVVAPYKNAGKRGTEAPRRSNIVVVYADDMRHDELVKVDRLRHMARSGTSFRRAYVTNPVCCPSIGRPEGLRGGFVLGGRERLGVAEAAPCSRSSYKLGFSPCWTKSGAVSDP